jgi:lipoprotein-anchoring transpeptidase ErfK/SrfK
MPQTPLMTRRDVLAGSAALLVAAQAAAPSLATTAAPAPAPDPVTGYLQSVVPRPGTPWLPPSGLHPAYSHAVYVNARPDGPMAQRMWVLQRDGAGAWRLALQDGPYWQGKAAAEAPAYSWPVSTGRKYPGDSRSGPTPLGIFNVDDRRYRPGWGSPGMYNALYIDLHYSGGRASGVAIHGTTPNQYRKLGRIDSHGCVRMHMANADQVWQLVHPDRKRGEASPLWGEIPRYFTSDPGKGGMSPRFGYVRDGSLLTGPDGQVLMRPGYRMVFVFFRDDA